MTVLSKSIRVPKKGLTFTLELLMAKRALKGMLVRHLQQQISGMTRRQQGGLDSGRYKEVV